MPRATIALDLPEHVWIADLSTQYPAAEFTVLAAIPGEETGAGLVDIDASDIEAVLTTMDAYDAVVSATVLEAAPERALVQFETTEPLLLLSLSEVGIPIELPISIVDGEVTVELTASRGKISQLSEQLRGFGIGFDLVSLRQSIDTETLLTEDQYALLETAVDRGYYDTPRTCTLTELAEVVGLAKSTTSEKLHRAEGKVIKEFLTGHDTTIR